MTPAKPSTLFIPSLAPLYARLGDWSDVLFRVLVGALFIPHGFPKLFGPTANFIAFFGKVGIPFPTLSVYLVGALEVFGGIALIVGLLTRPIAFMLFIAMMVAALHVHLPNGWDVSRGGAEYAAALAIMCLILAMRGSGPWSVDRKLIGKEF